MSPGRDGLPDFVPVHLPNWGLNVVTGSSDCERKAQVGTALVRREFDMVMKEL